MDNCQRALERNSRPNHPQSAPGSSRRPPPHQPFFPKILQEPWKCVTLVLATAIRAPGPAVTRHFATHEHRLPILPMSPNHAERTAALPVQPCRIRPLAAIPPKPFSVRLRSSQIVWDRPISYDRTAARHSRRIAEIFARFRPPNRQKSASIRVKIRLQRPVRKKPFRGIWELLSFPTTGQQKSASTACLRTTLTLVRMNLGAQTAARAAAVNRVLHQNQMNWSSDKCQPALNTIHYPLSTIHYPLFTIHHSLSTNRLCTRSAPSSDPETLLQSPQWYPQSKQCHQ